MTRTLNATTRKVCKTKEFLTAINSPTLLSPRKLSEVRVPQLEDQYKMTIFGKQHNLTA